MKIPFLLFMQIFKGLLTAYFFTETYNSSAEINLTCHWRRRTDWEEDSGKFMCEQSSSSYVEGKGKYQ